MSAATLAVTVNGETRSLPAGTHVGALVESLGRGRAGMAVAVNGEVVPRSTWDEHDLTDGDEIELLGAVQGG